MFRTATLSALAVSMITAGLWAQDVGARPTDEMPRGFETWFSELEEAYETHNPDRIGQLIEGMKEGSPVRRTEGGRAVRSPRRVGESGRPMGRREQARNEGRAFPNTLMANSEAEERTLAVLDDLERTKQQENMNIPIQDGRLLRLLVEAIDAENVVEIGTSNGYSGIWLCLALQETGGELTTFELDAKRASLARENFKKAGIDRKSVV